MTRRQLRIWVLTGMAFLFCCQAISAGHAGSPTGDAASVRQLLDAMATGRCRTDGGPGAAVVDESALNAYIADRLAHEKILAVRRLTVRLLGMNHISGIIDFDAGQLKLDNLLGDDLTFDFKGIVQHRDRAVRLHVIALTLNGYPVKPQVLEFVLGRLLASDQSQTGQIETWYPLPRGIENIRVHNGHLTVSCVRPAPDPP